MRFLLAIKCFFRVWFGRKLPDDARLLPLLRSSGPMRWINRVCGGLFTLMGGLLLFTRRQA